MTSGKVTNLPEVETEHSLVRRGVPGPLDFDACENLTSGSTLSSANPVQAVTPHYPAPRAWPNTKLSRWEGYGSRRTHGVFCLFVPALKQAMPRPVRNVFN